VAWAEMEGAEEVELNAVNLEGKLNQYKRMGMFGESFLPASADLSVETDRKLIRGMDPRALRAGRDPEPVGQQRGRGD
jgi:hypothetical protein